MKSEMPTTKSKNQIVTVVNKVPNTGAEELEVKSSDVWWIDRWTEHRCDCWNRDSKRKVQRRSFREECSDKKDGAEDQDGSYAT